MGRRPEVARNVLHNTNETVCCCMVILGGATPAHFDVFIWNDITSFSSSLVRIGDAPEETKQIQNKNIHFHEILEINLSKYMFFF